MGQSIQDMYEKLKAFIENDVYFYTLLIVMVSVLSFGLGRLSMHSESQIQQPRIVLTEQPAAVVVSETSQPTQKKPADTTQQLVASKNGTKYHLLTCPGVKQMKEENKIYFNSEAEARAAGYTPAANCKF